MGLMLDLPRYFRKRFLPSLVKRIAPYNAIIEGGFQDDSQVFYKVTRLVIPQKATVVNDGEYKLRLFGTTKDFEGVKKAETEKDLETMVDNLRWCKGAVIGGATPLLESVHTLCLKDGRVFADDAYLYEGYLKTTVQNAKKIFGKALIHALYLQKMSHF